MNTDLLGLELRLAQAKDSPAREQVVAHALAATPHDPWWLFVAARLIEARGEPVGDALAMLAARVKAHLLGDASCAAPDAGEDTQEIIDALPALPNWARELMRWVWLREAAQALQAASVQHPDEDPALARSLIHRALALPPPEPAAEAGSPAPSRDALRERWVGNALWIEALCMEVRIELSVAQPDAWSVAKAMESLSGIAAQGATALHTGLQLLADVPLAVHVLGQWLQRRDLAADARPLLPLSHLRARFRKGLPEDIEHARARAVQACGGKLARCEMLRTYLDTQESWRLHEGDLLLPDKVLRAEDNLIITGDLVCDTWLDTDVVVIVLGSLRCRSIYSRGGLCVVGDVIAAGLVLQHYNDWAFEVLGKLSARALVTLDKSVTVDRDRAVLEYSPWAPLHLAKGVDHGQRQSTAWLAIDPEAEVGEQVAAFMAMESAGRDPLPARSLAARAISDLAGEFDACQRAIAEGRLSESEALALLGHPDWAWELVTLIPPDSAVPALRQAFAQHADTRVRRAAVARLRADDWQALAEAAKDSDTGVRAEVALHAACPQLLWPALAEDAEASVRAALVLGRVTQGIALPPPLAGQLAQDAEASVRRAVALAPELGDELILKLLADEDEGVRLRVGRRATQSAHMLERMADDPAPSVRLALAGMAYDWRAPFDQHPGLARRLREKLVLDAEPAVRRAAAFGLTPVFLEAHSERLVGESVVELRRLLAACTRDLALQQRLLRDADVSVRRALAENPHAHADVLMELARTLPAGSLFEPDDALHRLAVHPHLSEEALRLIDQRVPNDHSHLFDDQPLAPLDLVVARLVHDHPYDPGSEEYTAYENLRARFPALAVMRDVLADVQENQGWPRRLMEAGIGYPRRWYHRILFITGFVALTLSMRFKAGKKLRELESREGAPGPVAAMPDEAALDDIARDMLASPVHDIRCAILGNRRCPPAALAEYVQAYLDSRRQADPPSDYTVRKVVANPALPVETMGKVVAHLCHTDDYELRSGLMRNAALPEALFTQLLGASSPDVRDAAREGVWRVHGVWVG